MFTVAWNCRTSVAREIFAHLAKSSNVQALAGSFSIAASALAVCLRSSSARTPCRGAAAARCVRSMITMTASASEFSTAAAPIRSSSSSLRIIRTMPVIFSTSLPPAAEITITGGSAASTVLWFVCSNWKRPQSSAVSPSPSTLVFTTIESKARGSERTGPADPPASGSALNGVRATMWQNGDVSRA